MIANENLGSNTTLRAKKVHLPGLRPSYKFVQVTLQSDLDKFVEDKDVFVISQKELRLNCREEN